MSEEELARELARLEQENQRLESDLGNGEEIQHKLISKATTLQQAAEIEEESMSLNLMRKMESAKRDVQQYKRQIKAEELNHQKLRQQIDDVKRQQSDVENQLEQEQEFLMLKLQRQLMETNNRKMEIERELAQERTEYLEVLHNQLRRLMAVTPLSLSKLRESGRPRSDSQMSSSSAALAPHSRAVTPCAALTDASLSVFNNPLGDSVLESPLTMFRSSRTGSPGLGHSHVDPRQGVSGTPSADESPSRPRASSVTTGGSATPTSKTIAELERQVNELLRIQAEYLHSAKVSEDRCVALSDRLHELQQRTFLDSAKASKLQEDLRKTKTELEVLQSTSNVVTQLSSSTHHRTLSEDSGSLVPHVASMHSLSLRDRTKELLSTPRVSLPSSSNPRRNRGGSQVSTTRSVSPPLPSSGYTSGVESTSRGGGGGGGGGSGRFGSSGVRSASGYHPHPHHPSHQQQQPSSQNSSSSRNPPSATAVASSPCGGGASSHVAPSPVAQRSPQGALDSSRDAVEIQTDLGADSDRSLMVPTPEMSEM